ncbi:type II toxin-antitoxin system CcdA family antitoxin, partial [Klebsiella oxytoca]|uniref:type II toxin-antitoxin system CcdA family antitoxin n=3 Tax=Enterobacterales TaxID=91347 RepID=UPI0033655DB3
FSDGSNHAISAVPKILKRTEWGCRMIQRTTRNVTVMPNAVPSDPEAKKQASSPWQEENQEGLEALNSFHAEYGHFSGD